MDTLSCSNLKKSLTLFKPHVAKDGQMHFKNAKNRLSCITLGRNSHSDVIIEECQFWRPNEQPAYTVQKHFPTKSSLKFSRQSQTPLE